MLRADSGQRAEAWTTVSQRSVVGTVSPYRGTSTRRQGLAASLGSSRLSASIAPGEAPLRRGKPFWGRLGKTSCRARGIRLAVRAMSCEHRTSRTVPYKLGIFRRRSDQKPEREWNLHPIRALRELGGSREEGDRLWGAGRHFLGIARLVRTQRYQV